MIPLDPSSVKPEVVHAALNEYIHDALRYFRPVIDGIGSQGNAMDVAVIAAFLMASLPDKDMEFSLTLTEKFHNLNIENIRRQGIDPNYDGPVFFHPPGERPSEKPSYERCLLSHFDGPVN